MGPADEKDGYQCCDSSRPTDSVPKAIVPHFVITFPFLSRAAWACYRYHWLAVQHSTPRLEIDSMECYSMVGLEAPDRSDLCSPHTYNSFLFSHSRNFRRQVVIPLFRVVYDGSMACLNVLSLSFLYDSIPLTSAAVDRWFALRYSDPLLRSRCRLYSLTSTGTRSHHRNPHRDSIRRYMRP